MTQKSNKANAGTIVVKVDEELEDLIPGFLENRQKDAEELINALGREDYETIRVLSHSMKGSGGGYGFDAISTLGKELETAAKEKDEKRIQALTDDLLVYVKQVEIVYE